MIRLACVAVLGYWMGHVDHVAAADHAPGQFQHHADVQISLFAQEPDIVDPVSLTFAANGDCFVVEMRDYPYGVGPEKKPGGSIRLLRDRNGDGRADESKLFASDLSFPTSVMAWRDGVLVVAPPEIRFLKDTDGDDKADVNEIVLTGLRRSVTDSNANSLRWGIDNLIHVVNGGNGGKVKLVGSDQPALNLGHSDFAFDLDSKTIIKTARTGGGFGLVFDDFGNSFTTHNLDYLQQRIIPTRYIEQSPEMFSFKATENISDHGVSARIYPIVQAVTRVNHPEQAGHFSSSGGMGILNSSLFSARLANSIFVCDVVCNIVHRDVLREDGPVFRAARAAEEQTSEFIASRDPAFRAVGLEHGPDGALYLIDMQRDVIEHPDYIPAAVREKLDIRAGQDRGRIYRVTPKDGLPEMRKSLANRTLSELVTALNSPARWHRETAHRLLLDRKDPPGEIIARIQDRGWKKGSPEARVRAIWISHVLGSGVKAMEAMQDPHTGVGQNAVLAIEQSMAESPELAMDLALSESSDPRIRFQVALTLDGLSSRVTWNEQFSKTKFDALLQILRQDHRNKWSRRAVLLAIDDESPQLLQTVWNSAWFQDLPNDRLQIELINELANVAAATASSDRDEFATWLLELKVSETEPSLIAALLSGLEAGWSRRGAGRLPQDQFAKIVSRWAAGNIEGFETPLIDLISVYEIDFPASLKDLFLASRHRAMNTDLDEPSRVAAIQILARDSSDETFELLMDLLSAPEPTVIQRAAIEGIGRSRRAVAGQRLLGVWSATSPGIRADLINLLLSRREHQSALLTALERGTVQFSELNLDLEQRRRLLRWSSDDIGKRAARLFGDEEYSNRKEVVDQWLAKLPELGDTSIGREVFGKKCATCHVVQGEGNRVGPDLQALAHRSVEDLLTHILDPNMSINPNYVSCVVETVDGQIINGLLSEETSQSITLKQAEGKSQTIARSDIEQLKTLKTSLMPEGIEKELTPLQLRSLIAYLQEN